MLMHFGVEMHDGRSVSSSVTPCGAMRPSERGRYVSVCYCLIRQKKEEQRDGEDVRPGNPTRVSNPSPTSFDLVRSMTPRDPRTYRLRFGPLVYLSRSRRLSTVIIRRKKMVSAVCEGGKRSRRTMRDSATFLHSASASALVGSAR